MKADALHYKTKLYSDFAQILLGKDWVILVQKTVWPLNHFIYPFKKKEFTIRINSCLTYIILSHFDKANRRRLLGKVKN